jgi:hypothetical protein
MVNIYLFIELLHTANAVATVETLKALRLDNCKFANVVATPIYYPPPFARGANVLPHKGGAGRLGNSVPSIPIDQALHALMLGAVGTAIDGVAVLHAVPDDAAAAMRADRRERRDRAFE